jgi:DNA-binding transcriptional ArsR family regulator
MNDCSYVGGMRMAPEQESFQCEYICVHEAVVARVKTSMPGEDTLFDLSELFKIFGDSTRIKILYCLFANEMCVCDIATLLQMSQSAISHQLAVLKRSRLIASRREGKTVFYALADDHVRTIVDQGIEHVTE